MLPISTPRTSHAQGVSFSNSSLSCFCFTYIVVFFCYSVDKQNFYSSCYRCCLFSMHWRIFASSCCYFVVFCIIGRISLMNILTFEHSVILDIFAFFDIVFHFISTFLFSSIGALFLYRHSLT